MVVDNKVAPWPDFAGQPIHEGDVIVHPATGEYGRVFRTDAPDPADAWRVDYGYAAPSRLCLQIGDRGMAQVMRTVFPVTIKRRA